MATISDFFGSYPYIEDPLFSTEIARKAEFAELTLEPRETLAIKRGGAFKHQKFAVRYLYWYDRLLLLHEPGTGKSCIIVHSAELFKREFSKDETDPTKIRRAVILISGDTLKENIRNEIVCKCTDRVYETDEILLAEGSAMKNRLTRLLQKWYDVMTYNDLANEIRKKQTEEALDEYMSNKIFYVDEAHNLPTLKDIARRRNPPTTIREAALLAREHESKYQQKPRKRGKDTSPRAFGESTYETIFRAFHKGHRNKIVLATATPMINSTLGIIPLMNLILPLTDAEFPGPMPRLTEDQLDQQGPEFFEPYFRGRVSYVRSLETGVVPSPQGQSLVPESETAEVEGYRLGQNVVYPVAMSPFQYLAYRRAYDRRNRQSTVGASEKQLNAFYGDEKHASLFVFPDGSFGNAGFDKYVEIVNNQYRAKNNRDGQELLANISDYDRLRVLSAKYSETVQLCLESYPESEVEYDVDHGIVFVYFADFNVGSGAGVFTLCLKAFGYEEFRASSDVFTSSQPPTKARPSRPKGGLTGLSSGPCPPSGDTVGERSLSIEKAKRFIFLTSKTTRAQIHNYFKVLNSYENRYGEYIQVVVASKRAREGININNGIKQIMASGSWNYSRNYQARERVFRSTSHDIRLEEERQKLVREGRNPLEAEIPLKTYNLVSIYEGDEEAPVDDITHDPLIDTVDTIIYLKIEEKDIPIRRIMRFAKQSGPDCYLNKARNIRASDMGHDNEQTCDYGPCDYDCFGIDPETVGDIDFTTKILYYSGEEVKAAEDEIRVLFSRFYSLKIDQIKQLIPGVSPIYIDMALNALIRNNQQILNRLGYPGYLREGPNGIIYLEKDQFEIRSHPENTAYTSPLIGTQDPRNNIFSDYVTKVQYDKEQEEIIRLAELSPNSAQFIDKLNALSLISKVNLLELVTDKKLRQRITSDFIDAVIAVFHHALFSFDEPVEALRQVEYDLSNQHRGRGRPPNPDKRSRSRRVNFSEDVRAYQGGDPGSASEKVYVHTLLNQGSHDTTNYGKVSKHQKAEGQYRILKPSETGVGWRNVNEVEYIVYNEMIRNDITDVQNYYERFPFYGIKMPGEDAMSIRDRRFENPEQAARDKRKRRTGKNCTYFNKQALINFLYEMDVYPDLQIPENITRDEMINFIQRQPRGRGAKADTVNLDDYEDDQLRHLYAWYSLGSTKGDLCAYIEQRFEETNRLYTGRNPQTQLIYTEPNVGSIRTGADLITVEYVPEDEPVIIIEEEEGEYLEGEEPEIELEIEDPTVDELPGIITGQL